MSDLEVERFVPHDVATLATPALVVDYHQLIANLDRLLETVPADQLCPHAKTHKTTEITKLLVARGVHRQKCATLAEAEVLASAGVRDVIIAYPLVQPNINRLQSLRQRYPSVNFCCLIDDPEQIVQWQQTQSSETQDVLVDVDVGMHRTGAPISDVPSLVKQISESAVLKYVGLHVYDGHLREADVARKYADHQAVRAQVEQLLATLADSGIETPMIVGGGSPTFMAWANWAKTDARIHCSPGTLVLNDVSYWQSFSDLPFRPAAALLTRVVSQPVRHPHDLGHSVDMNFVTLDLGSKAVAADPSLEQRAQFPSLREVKLVSQSEEHLRIVTRDPIAVGSVQVAFPGHVCPTCFAHEEMIVVKDRQVIDRWPISARNRLMTFEHPIR